MSELFSQTWNLTVGSPQVAAWTKYWVALCGDQLYYYPAKSLKATERKHVGHTSTQADGIYGTSWQESAELPTF